MAVSPHIGKVDIELAQEVAASPQPCEVGNEPAPKVIATADIEEEKEEDENRDIHFK